MLLLSVGLSRLYYMLLDVPWLKVEEIEITGLKKLGRGEVLNTMGVNKGECILNLRMRTIADRLTQLPTIKAAAVRMDSPSRIVAEITEREQIATVKCGDSFLLLDNDGMLFAQTSLEGERTIPLITGLCGPNLKEGGSLSARSLEQIKALLAALDDSRNWLSTASVQECRWKPNGFTLVLGERGVPVDIGKENFARKLVKLKKVIRTLNERQWTELVTRIDLDYPGKAYLDGQFPVSKPVQGQGKQPG
ncbi:MAG: cell division protein FtsQ/DivIB [Syntrophobacteraceae bacterium]